MLFLTFTTVIGTLVVQGLSLPLLVRVLKLPGRDVRAETLAEAQAQADASTAADERLDALLADPRNALPDPLTQRLRTVMERRRNAVWERLGRSNPVTGESADDTYRSLAREMIAAEREVFVRLRDERRIDDEMLRALLQPSWTWKRPPPTGSRTATGRDQGSQGCPVTTAVTVDPGAKAPSPASTVSPYSSLAT